MNRLLRIADWMFACTARWWIISLYLFAFIITNVLIMGGVSRFEQVANGQPLLEDPRSYATAGIDLYDIARQYPPEAAQIYKTEIQPLDIIFPLSAGLFFGTLLYKLVLIIKPNTRWRILGLLGTGLTLSDYCENIGVFTILRTIDTPLPAVMTAVRVASLLKMLVGFGAISCILGALVWILVRWLSGGRQQRMR